MALSFESLPAVIEEMSERVKTIEQRLIAQQDQAASQRSKTAGFITRKEACELLHVSTPTVYAWIKQGKLKSYRIGGRTLFKENEVLEAVKPFDYSILPTFSLSQNVTTLPRELQHFENVKKVDIKKISNFPGIYFLIKKNKLVYIGKSINVVHRINTHILENKKDFDTAYYISIPESKIDVVETTLIAKYKPKYNKILPSPHQITLKDNQAIETINGIIRNQQKQIK